jgi:hypothetical protein
MYALCVLQFKVPANLHIGNIGEALVAGPTQEQPTCSAATHTLSRQTSHRNLTSSACIINLAVLQPVHDLHIACMCMPVRIDLLNVPQI